MNLPFTTEQFLHLFEEYNLRVFPIQFLLYIPALLTVILAAVGGRRASALVSLLLAVLWFWSGVAYHLIYFTKINPAAWLFGIAFIAQASLLLYYGVYRRELAFSFRPTPRGWFGTILIIYALLVYPLLSTLLGHHYPSTPTFGLPCPITILTFGIFLWTIERFSWPVLLIPILWAIIGATAALSLGIIQDIGLLVAAAITSVFAARHNRNLKKRVTGITGNPYGHMSA